MSGRSSTSLSRIWGDARERLLSSSNCHAMGRNIVNVRRRAANDSSCLYSIEHPVFRALKNSSIVHLDRYISATRRMSAFVLIGSEVSRNHSMGTSPSGTFSSVTQTTLTKICSGEE